MLALPPHNADTKQQTGSSQANTVQRRRIMKSSLLVALLAIVASVATVNSAPLSLPLKAVEEAAKDVGSKASSSGTTDEIAEVQARLARLKIVKQRPEEILEEDITIHRPGRQDRLPPQFAWGQNRQYSRGPGRGFPSSTKY
ncbi:uncharacterized protein UTRI_10482_B [Ustilago trichophora]|uniref:Uncharacterized protein n=1 Tax=Ustilago trichophora TaxID=86804 RepID=A0A5C3EBJ1_9BASI|nr:uncharacterized protein UTRI_10482_B [Ustilago trichophora]